MNIADAVSIVGNRFVYTPDKISLFDSWSVMKDHDGKMFGDCDNFALTAIWYACDRSIWKFILYVLILHKYRFWFCMTEDGEKHVVGYAQGKYFDNFTYKALDKESFFSRTKHRRLFVYPSPIILLYMIIGIFI